MAPPAASHLSSSDKSAGTSEAEHGPSFDRRTQADEGSDGTTDVDDEDVQRLWDDEIAVCSHRPTEAWTFAVHPEQPGLQVATHGTAMALLWRTAEGRLTFQHWDDSGPSEPTSDFEAADAPGAPELVGEGTGWRMGWLEKRAGQSEHFTQLLSRHGLPEGFATQVTEDTQRRRGRTEALTDRIIDEMRVLAGLAAPAAFGEAALIDERATGSVSVAQQQDEVGVVYDVLVGGVRRSVYFQRVDAEGTPRGPVMPLEPAPFQVSDASIAAFGRGYVVAYRSQRSAYVDRSDVRLAFVDRHGQVVYRVDLTRHSDQSDAEVSGAGEHEGTPVVASDAGGRLIVAWDLPAQAEGRQARAMRLSCVPALDLCLR